MSSEWQEDWRADALCAQVDVGELFFPELGVTAAEAKKVCNLCVVRAECLKFAVDNDLRFGVFGGTSERERRRMQHGLPPRREAPKRRHPQHGWACKCSQCRAA